MSDLPPDSTLCLNSLSQSCCQHNFKLTTLRKGGEGEGEKGKECMSVRDGGVKGMGDGFNIFPEE